MQRNALLAVLLLAALIGAGAWAYVSDRQRESVAHAARERRAAERRERAEERFDTLRSESGRLMPEVVGGIELGMTLEEARRVRRSLAPAVGREDPHLVFYEESLTIGSDVMYGFDRQSQRLAQVQILSLLPSTDAIAPHLAAMNERYGTPTGIWDCPITGGVPTRRFTWRGSTTTVSDVFLLYGERVSLTLYIATSDQIGRSLAMAACRPVPGDRIGEFPVESAEQMQAASGGGGT